MDTSRLERILAAEAAGYASFVTRLPLKIAVIQRREIVALQQLLSRETEEQHKLRGLERDRLEEAARLNHGLGLPGDAPLAATLSRIPDRSAAERLGALGDRLGDLARRLKVGNERCGILLGAGLEFVRFSMEFYARFLNPDERLADMLYGPAAVGTGVSNVSLMSRSA